MCSNHRILGMVVILTLVTVIAGLVFWYHTSLRFSLIENALLNGQSITIPVMLNDLQDLSKPVIHHSTAPVKPMQPHIALLIAGLGADEQLTQAALNLPPSVALAFTPHTANLEKWATAASSHPIFLEISANAPASTSNTNNTRIDNDHAIAQAETVLSHFGNYTGVYTRAEAKTLFSVKNMRPFLDSLKARNLLFVYNNDGHGQLQQLASEFSLAAIEANKTIDDGHSSAITSLLADIETMANESGQTLVVIEATSPAELQILSDWNATLEDKGLKMVPVTDFVRKIE